MHAYWRLVLASLLLLAAHACVTSAHTVRANERSDNRPNFLVITSEDMSPNLGCYGDPNATTPFLDDLARRGNRYANAYANGPICSPARTALLFSKYQTSLGAGNHRSRATTPPDLLGFASHLRAAGYFCTNHPKVDYNTPTAWDIERATYDRGRDWTAPGRNGRPFLSIINIDVSHQSWTSVLPHEQYRAGVRQRLSIDAIHDPADMVVPPYFPDTPAVRKELARYADCVSLMDRRAGDILRRLKADWLAGDTIVIYFSDHGAGHPRHKSTPFASGLRVPFIVYCPPKYQHLLRVPPGEACDDIVMFIDVGPTLLSLAGVAVPDSMHGVPFLGYDARSRQLAFGALDRRAESYNLSRTVSDGRHVYIRNYMPHIPLGQPKGYGFPSAIYQELARGHRDGTLPDAARPYLQPSAPEMLFDLERDPHETVNVVDDPAYADVLARLRTAHHAKIREFHDLNFLPEEELARRAGDRPWIELGRAEPLDAIYAAADLVGRGPEVLDQQLALLNHDDPVVRWWAVLGLWSQYGTRPDVRAAIRGAMDDQSELVSIEASALALRNGVAPDEAKRTLLRHVASENRFHAHRAARACQLLRMNDDDALATIDAASARHRTEWLREVSAAITRQRVGLE